MFYVSGHGTSVRPTPDGRGLPSRFLLRGLPDSPAAGGSQAPRLPGFRWYLPRLMPGIQTRH